MQSRPAPLRRRPRLGPGKTTVTAALAWLHRPPGRRVRLQMWPDFLDPQIHAAASGQLPAQPGPRHAGEADARWRLAAAAGDNDLILVEGVMGFLRRHALRRRPSLASFAIPVMAVIDARAVAQTFAPSPTARHPTSLAALLRRPANRIPRQPAPRRGCCAPACPPASAGMVPCPRDAEAALPEPPRIAAGRRDSDLHPPSTRPPTRIAATGAGGTAAGGRLRPRRGSPPLPPRLAGCRIAIARDAAHGFILPRQPRHPAPVGAELSFFSPGWRPSARLRLPSGSSAATLNCTAAAVMAASLTQPPLPLCGRRQAPARRMRRYDEPLRDSSPTRPVRPMPLPALLPWLLSAASRSLGMQAADLPEAWLCGHTFHSFPEAQRPGAAAAGWHAGRFEGEAIYRRQRLTASYVHFYFPPTPRRRRGAFCLRRWGNNSVISDRQSIKTGFFRNLPRAYP